ncbi:MAG: alpha/beta hydrolase [Saprospiraceae bacterium]|nr:alpha/beta hydrolase [Saprospiraceae bacterium]
MDSTIIEENGFKYVEEGEGKVLLLLHGLFGALSNFTDLINHFKTNYKVVIPILPLYELPLKKTSVPDLVNHVEQFVAHKGYDKVNLIGNSLGGHVGLLFALANLEQIESITLTGSSGLFENSLGNSFPKRGNYDYIKTKTEATFYDPKTATKELVDEVFAIVQDNMKVLRILSMARSAIRQNLRDKIGDITAPTLLIWGMNDTITPPFVGEEFDRLMPNSTLHLVDKCGHAPMMEQPELFNKYLEEFLIKL